MTRNRKIIASLVAVAASLAGAVALAQVVLPLVANVNPGDYIQNLPNGQALATNQYMTVTQLRNTALAQGAGHGGTPVPTITTSICGGSTGTLVGTDASGQIAEGSSASTSCVVTFAKAFATAPECFVDIDNVVDASLKCSASTTALTITKTSNASEKINYLIVGVPGG